MRLFDAIRVENEQILRLLRQLEDSTAGQPEIRGRLLERLSAMVDEQRRLDEGYVYPLFTAAERRDGLIRRSRREVDELFKSLDHLRGRPMGEPGIRLELELLSSSLREHLKHESRELLPMARRLLGDEEEARVSQRVASDFPHIGRRLRRH